MEVWKPILFLNFLYEASNLGRIRRSIKAPKGKSNGRPVYQEG